MSYKPKFCCECAEKIERADWRPWTSKRFCELCATEYGVGEKLQMGLIVGVLLFGLIGISGFWQKNQIRSNSASNLIAANPSNKIKAETNQAISSQQPTSENNSAPTSTQIQTANSAVEAQQQPTKPPIFAAPTQNPKNKTQSDQSDAVYYCGAQTKKGTPCSRRVKGGGRCWQHVGQPAMYPQGKLIVKSN